MACVLDARVVAQQDMCIAHDVCNCHGHILITIIGMLVVHRHAPVIRQNRRKGQMLWHDATSQARHQSKSHLPPLRRSRASGSEFTVASPVFLAFAFEHVMMANNRGPDILTKAVAGRDSPKMFDMTLLKRPSSACTARRNDTGRRTGRQAAVRKICCAPNSHRADKLAYLV